MCVLLLFRGLLTRDNQIVELHHTNITKMTDKEQAKRLMGKATQINCCNILCGSLDLSLILIEQTQTSTIIYFKCCGCGMLQDLIITGGKLRARNPKTKKVERSYFG